MYYLFENSKELLLNYIIKQKIGKNEIEKIKKQKATPLKIFKSKKYFFAFTLYKKACEIIEEYFNIFNANIFPFEISFNKINHFLLPWDFNLIKLYFENKI